MGKLKKVKRSPRLSDETVRKIRKDHRAGQTTEDIATAMKIPPSTVYGVISYRTYFDVK